MKSTYSSILFFLSSAICLAQNYPFPQNQTYTAGTIKPSHKTTQQINTSVTSFYNSFKTKYIKNCNTHYYIDQSDEVQDNGNGQTLMTTSEAHGYGMIIALLMAGYDVNAKTIYDGMYDYYKAHTSSINNNLMSWQQVTCSDAAGNDDSAIDGDLDIAYSLLLADFQWGSAGAINYLVEAKAMINAIMAAEIHSAYYPLLGDWAMGSSAAYKTTTRSSDFLLDHFKAFEAATSDTKWNSTYEKIQSIIAYIQSSTANPAQTGLLPDFISKANTATPGIPTGKVLESNQDGWYNWNACRDPWRLATDYLITGDTRSKISTQMIITWLKGKTTNPANFICNTKVDGTGTVKGELAFIAPYMVGMMVDASNQTALNSTYDWVVAESIGNWTYFSNAIKMLCLLTVSGNYWYPDLFTGIAENNYNSSIINASIGQNENTAFIILNSSAETLTQLSVFDDLGNLIWIENAVVSGHYAIPFSTENLSNGMYILNVQSGSEQKSIKFIK